MDKSFIFGKSFINKDFLKSKVFKLKEKSSKINSYHKDSKSLKELVNFNFEIKKKRPKAKYLKKEEGAPETEKEKEKFDIYYYKYPLGFFAGCNSFTFRITFKEYKMGLKPAKFSLLLNQFNLNLDIFISLVEEIMVNNFPLEFYETFFGTDLNDLDLKFHFLVMLRTRDKHNIASKFYLIPKGCFLSHLKNQVWWVLLTDSLFIKILSLYHKEGDLKISVIFLLILYYIYKLIHHRYIK